MEECFTEINISGYSEYWRLNEEYCGLRIILYRDSHRHVMNIEDLKKNNEEYCERNNAVLVA